MCDMRNFNPDKKVHFSVEKRWPKIAEFTERPDDVSVK